jgi:hypothetical protein
MMAAKTTEHPWSREALFNKALVYVAEMEGYTADDWRFGLLSSLSLEFLARAALAYISPTLLADGKNWRNIHHALGHPPTAKAFTPKSVSTGELLSILNELVPAFTKELSDFCVTHSVRRNAELHSGEDAFSGLGTSEWLPKFYASCHVLLRSMGKDLSDFFGDPKSVQEMIDSIRDAAAKSVRQDIDIQRRIWSQKSPEEQQQAREQATVWATRQGGHRVRCPACESAALVRGSAHGSVTTQTEDEDITQKQTMLPSSFECIACGLKISGLSKLSACGLGDAFIATSTFSAAEFYNLHTEEELAEARSAAAAAEPEFDEDFNE